MANSRREHGTAQRDRRQGGDVPSPGRRRAAQPLHAVAADIVTENGPASGPFDFVSTSEAAQMLGVALRTVQIWVENGSLVAWKTHGGHRRIVRASVDRLLRQQQHAVASSHDRHGFRLLIVEDDQRLRRLYEIAVGKWKLPIDLTLARDGFEGLLEAGRKRPHLIIADLHMPGMNGFRMIEAIRQDPGAKVEFLIVTGLSQDRIDEQGGLGANIPVIFKPVSMSRIQELVAARVHAFQAGAAASH